MNLSKYTSTEIVRYFGAGLLVFGADFSLLYWLTEIVGFPYLFSNFLSVTVGVILSYLFCVQFVFSHRCYASRKKVEFGLFTVTCLTGLLMNEVLLWLFVSRLMIHYLVAKIVVTIVIFLFNFVLKKKVLFTNRAGTDTSLG